MSRIVTISREFGSGGRELGKRLADLLGWDYYDKQIIAAIASNRGMDEHYVEKALENHIWRSVPLSFRSSISGMGGNMWSAQTELWLEQKRVIEAIAASGKDCVIIGRNADVLLRGCGPLTLFVCAGMDAKAARCMERAEPGEKLTRRELERKMRDIDKGRAQLREIIGGGRWGEPGAYHLTVNTTDWNIKDLAEAVAKFTQVWFAAKD